MAISLGNIPNIFRQTHIWRISFPGHVMPNTIWSSHWETKPFTTPSSDISWLTPFLTDLMFDMFWLSPFMLDLFVEYVSSLKKRQMWLIFFAGKQVIKQLHSNVWAPKCFVGRKNKNKHWRLWALHSGPTVFRNTVPQLQVGPPSTLQVDSQNCTVIDWLIDVWLCSHKDLDKKKGAGTYPLMDWLMLCWHI